LIYRFWRTVGVFSGKSLVSFQNLNPARAFPAACGGVSEHLWNNNWIEDSSRLAARSFNCRYTVTTFLGSVFYPPFYPIMVLFNELSIYLSFQLHRLDIYHFRAFILFFISEIRSIRSSKDSESPLIISSCIF
jgi:hypothetical protein